MHAGFQCQLCFDGFDATASFVERKRETDGRTEPIIDRNRSSHIPEHRVRGDAGRSCVVSKVERYTYRDGHASAASIRTQA